jgi:hypothetical protein
MPKFIVPQNPTDKTLTDLRGALKWREARRLLHYAATVIHDHAATPASSTSASSTTDVVHAATPASPTSASSTTDVAPTTATPSPSPWQAPPPSPKVYLSLSFSLPYMCTLDVIHALFSRLMKRPDGSIPRDPVNSIKDVSQHEEN